MFQKTSNGKTSLNLKHCKGLAIGFICAAGSAIAGVAASCLTPAMDFYTAAFATTGIGSIALMGYSLQKLSDNPTETIRDLTKGIRNAGYTGLAISVGGLGLPGVMSSLQAAPL